MNKFLKILNSVFYFFVIITFSINFVIYFRPFYYWHIKPLKIAETSGKSVFEIKQAYNEIMNYLSLGQKYGVGVLKSSVEGQNHFYDVKILFIISLVVFLVSLIGIICISIYKYKKRNTWNRGLLTEGFYGSVSLLLFFGIVGGLASINFDKAFEIFHKIFFIGKSNWVFDSSKDEIINVLPQEFFRNSAIFIFSIMGLITLSIIIYNVIKVIYIRKNIKKFKINSEIIEI